MRHGTHLNEMHESCHTYEEVISHIWMRSMFSKISSVFISEFVCQHLINFLKSQLCRHVIGMNAAWHTFEWDARVMSHIWRSHITHLNEINVLKDQLCIHVRICLPTPDEFSQKSALSSPYTEWHDTPHRPRRAHWFVWLCYTHQCDVEHIAWGDDASHVTPMSHKSIWRWIYCVACLMHLCDTQYVKRHIRLYDIWGEWCHSVWHDSSQWGMPHNILCHTHECDVSDMVRHASLWRVMSRRVTWLVSYVIQMNVTFHILCGMPHSLVWHMRLSRRVTGWHHSVRYASWDQWCHCAWHDSCHVTDSSHVTSAWQTSALYSLHTVTKNKIHSEHTWYIFLKCARCVHNE